MGFAYEFYVSPEWRKCRAGYIRHKHGLCERCAEQGYVVTGTQVHHKIKLTPRNIDNPDVTLNWANLELLCDDCHEREHGKHKQRADAYGHVDI